MQFLGGVPFAVLYKVERAAFAYHINIGFKRQLKIVFPPVFRYIGEYVYGNILGGVWVVYISVYKEYKPVEIFAHYSVKCVFVSV